MNSFKIGDKVVIIKEPTIRGVRHEQYLDRKKGDVATISLVYSGGDPTVGISISTWIIDKDCLTLYPGKVTNWREELKNGTQV